MTYGVRPIRPWEIRPMAEAGGRVHLESVYAPLDYSTDKVVQLAELALTKPERFFLEVITRNDRAIGVLFCLLADSFFGDDTATRNLIFFVEPAHRTRCGRAISQIVEIYKAWAVQRGAKLATLSISTGLTPERTAATYEHLGFSQTGTEHGRILLGWTSEMSSKAI